MSDYDSSDVDYWNVKVYHNGREKETLRGLTYGRAHALMTIFEREGVRAKETAYDNDGEESGAWRYHVRALGRALAEWW